MSQVDFIPAAVVLAAGAVASVTDVWKFKVYNALTLPLLGTGLLYHGLVYGWAGLGDSVLGILFGFGVLFLFHLLGGMGAGDVKLMMGIGAWLGMPLTMYICIASALAAGAYAVVLVLFTGRLLETITAVQVLCYRMTSLGRYLGSGDRMERDVKSVDRRRRVIPYGAMIAIGVVYTIIYCLYIVPTNPPR